MRALLIVGDSNIANFISRGLHEQGFIVDVASSGKIGEARAFTHEFDVIVLDWLLPDKDGLAVCKELRARELTTPTLLLTVRRSSVDLSVADRVTALNSGADDSLTKPFAFDELLARIRAILRRPRVMGPLVLRFGDLTFELVNRRVARRGVRIDLTAKEYAILEVLMRNAGETVSRTSLMQLAWTKTPERHSIVAHMGHLRKKIDRVPGRGLIRTVQGVGYRLEEGVGRWRRRPVTVSAGPKGKVAVSNRRH
jgi:DNA-binding response OmpR family regulator